MSLQALTSHTPTQNKHTLNRYMSLRRHAVMQSVMEALQIPPSSGMSGAKLQLRQEQTYPQSSKESNEQANKQAKQTTSIQHTARHQDFG